MTPLSDEHARHDIRTALDDTLLVEAAAGTGKTTELVNRMVAVLGTGRATVDTLIGVTFTEKAAGELKLRLRSALELARHEAGGDDTRRSRFEQALGRLEEARLSTIHGFCADLLRERSIQAEVDPEFKTLTDLESMRLHRESFTLWLQEQLSSPPEGVRRSLRRAESRRPSEDGPVDRLAQAAWTLALWRDFPTRWRRDPFDRVGHVDALVRQLGEFVRLRARCAAPLRDNFFRGTIRAAQVDDAIQTTELVRSRDYDGIEAHLVDLATDRSFTRPLKGSGKVYGPETTRAEVHAAHESLVFALSEFARRADADLASLLQGELLEAVEAYEVLKNRTGRLDFVDLLVRTRNLLRDRADVRAEFQSRFTHVFIDEFQDTDPLQAEILLLLASDDPGVSNWREARPRAGKLFLVGDPKQSIYRFRRADVGTYLEVKDLLIERGARTVTLATSFRAVPRLQEVVNDAFAPLMTRDPSANQAAYVPLQPSRNDGASQPATIVLPVPKPHGSSGRVTKAAIESSLPGAVGAFVEWLLTESGWTVTERENPEARVPVQARHICLLFRRLESYFAGDVAKPYVEALEARGVRHLLVGGRSFHAKEEVETMRTALVAIEWPDDELSVFATLRGELFAIGDAELLEYRRGHRRLHPFRRVAGELPERLQPIDDALVLLAELHRARNERPIAETITLLLEATRAHAAFTLRPSGEQVLANVLHVAEQARRYEGSGGISFRGFVEELLEDAKSGKTAEAPILEDGSDGVRIMTVHKAKGLEFPVVVLADITASLVLGSPGRTLDPATGLCAVRIAGWSPSELIENQDVELQRDLAEGIRLAYVAATRARDLLVVPAIGEGAGSSALSPDDPGQASWVSPLFPALYPPRAGWSQAEPAPGCPPFGRVSLVLDGADALEGPPACVSPGRHRVQGRDVVWWDPNLLSLDATPVLGVRQEDLIEKTVERAVVEADRARHDTWLARRNAVITGSMAPSLRIYRATDLVGERAADPSSAEAALLATLPLHEIRVERAATASVGRRPGGARFGTLVHAILASIPLGAGEAEVTRVARLHARTFGSPADEEASARAAVGQALAHPLIRRAAAVDPRHVRREAAVTLRVDDDVLVDGVVDLLFLEDGEWTVVDFKTDREIERGADAYERQVALYALGVMRATGQSAHGVLFRV
jgi:ATP-dependent exoDNAse (exonuclease V) beta subunit